MPAPFHWAAWWNPCPFLIKHLDVHLGSLLRMFLFAYDYWLTVMLTLRAILEQLYHLTILCVYVLFLRALYERCWLAGGTQHGSLSADSATLDKLID